MSKKRTFDLHSRRQTWSKFKGPENGAWHTA